MPRTIKRAYAENRNLKCSVGWCTNLRRGLARYCTMHENNLKRNGHVKARSIPKTELRGYQARVAAFLDAHAGDPTVRQAVAWCASLLRGAQNEKRPLAGYLQRLSVKGITGREVLERVAAAWLLSWQDPYRLPDDDRLTFQLAKQVLYTRPLRGRFMGVDKKGRRKHRAPRPQGATLRTLGTRVRENLAPFVAHMVMELEAQVRAAPGGERVGAAGEIA